MGPGDIMEMLAEGERKAIARSTEVAAAVLARPQLIKILVEALASPNKTIVSHAAHALLTIFRKKPDLLQPFAKQLLAAFMKDQWEVLLELAKIIPGLELKEAEQKTFVQRLEQVFYKGSSSFARTSALQALDDLAAQHKVWRNASSKALKFALEEGSKAMQARARKLIGGGN